MSKSSRHQLQHERGQSAIIVAMLLVALMGMLALTFDGGYTYFQRRLAQTAADAGALAGARELCMTGDEASAEVVAEAYATENNAAQTATALAVDGTGMITVTTDITFTTAFGGIIGTPQIAVHATASAGCFAPGAGTGVLPVAFACKPPDFDDPDNPFDPMTDCALFYDDTHTYIIMDWDTASTDYYCQDPPNSGSPAGAMDCDYDNDGYDDIFASGGRSWLNLDGNEGSAAEMRDWILDGYPYEITVHTWAPEKTGVSNAIFGAVWDKVYVYNEPDVVLPVFDYYCNGYPTTTCPGLVHAEDTIQPPSGDPVYYHIISFSLFHITCVQANGKHTRCPVAESLGISSHEQLIEGYFVEGFVPGMDGRPSDGVYAGAFTLYLTR